MNADRHGTHAHDSVTAADTDVAQEPGPSTDPELNARIRPMKSGGNTLPWKLLSLLLALALALSLWTGHRGVAGQAEGGSVADTVTVGLKLAPTNLDIRNQSGTALDQLLVGNVYQGLVSRDSRNRVRPGLAKTWNVSEDGLVYTFHLHEGIRFSNGHALRAQDVVDTIRGLKAGH